MVYMIEIGKTYRTNQGYEVKIIRELKMGYYLASGPENKNHVFDRKGVSAMYVNLFLML